VSVEPSALAILLVNVARMGIATVEEIVLVVKTVSAKPAISRLKRIERCVFLL
jgi:hypothetical protein